METGDTVGTGDNVQSGDTADIGDKVEAGATMEAGGTEAEGMPALYTVESTPDKGKGTFATRRITRGTCIISEAPLFKMRNKLIERNIAQNAIAEKLRQLSKDQQRAFFDLHNQFPGMGAFPGIVKSNALPLNETGKGGIFLQCARINQSCIPNAYHEYNSNTGQMTLYATRDIPQGEEITINYFWDTGPVRRKFLREYYGFECVCAHCKLPAAEREASDAHLNEVYSLYDVARDKDYALFDPLDSLHVIHRIWSLLNYEHITDIRLARAYMNGFDLAALNGDAARARFFACSAYNELRNCIGENGVGVQDWKARMNDPKLSPLFGTTHRWASEPGDMCTSKDVKEFHAWLWKLEKKANNMDAGNGFPELV
ncbi:MAG: hypothetical protein M1835_001436 [Candelina submexicana]|nr:MAG: hypothetical protein M1835_001436 [Candelina submexicana]